MDPRTRYATRVLDRYRKLPGTLHRTLRQDRNLALRLYDRGVPLQRSDLVLALAPDLPLQRRPIEPIRSLHYLPLIRAGRRTALPEYLPTSGTGSSGDACTDAPFLLRAPTQMGLSIDKPPAGPRISVRNLSGICVRATAAPSTAPRPALDLRPPLTSIVVVGQWDRVGGPLLSPCTRPHEARANHAADGGWADLCRAHAPCYRLRPHRLRRRGACAAQQDSGAPALSRLSVCHKGVPASLARRAWRDSPRTQVGCEAPKFTGLRQLQLRSATSSRPCESVGPETRQYTAARWYANVRVTWALIGLPGWPGLIGHHHRLAGERGVSARVVIGDALQLRAAPRRRARRSRPAPG
jgi:hypothetical protein